MRLARTHVGFWLEGPVMTKVYRASPIRLRATQAELQQRERFLIDYATEHYPVTVRQKQGFG